MRKAVRMSIIIVLIVVPIVTVLLLTSCAKLVNTETQTVEVTIVDEYHRGSYITPMKVGKVTTMQTHPAINRITVSYNGVEYTINGKDTYDKYCDKIGEIANATLEIRTYDDGTVKHVIVALE